MSRDIQWTDQDPGTGQRRFVRAEKFARKWEFKVRSTRRGVWAAATVTRAMWEELLEALERRVQRSEGITEADVLGVRAIVESMPEDEEPE